MNKETLFELEEMLSPFDAIKEVDGEGHEWWNSRKLARLQFLAFCVTLPNIF